MSSPVQFLQQTYIELKQVVWPSKQEVLRLTLIVICISVAVGAYIGILDAVFTRLIEFILKFTTK